MARNGRVSSLLMRVPGPPGPYPKRQTRREAGTQSPRTRDASRRGCRSGGPELQRSVRWLALPIAALALVGISGDVRADSAVGQRAHAFMASPASESANEDAPERLSLASRTQPRIEEPPVAQPEPETVVEVAPAPVAPVVRQPAVPATCPVNQFCYPRVGIAGPIVPYNDCTGSTDVGTAIRSLTCVSPTYFAAHAYTQFGRIAGWRAGDVVFAYGARYTVVDAFTQPCCVPPARAVAPLSMQTSLTPALCGPILVVQARPG
jgi:hypothetical protein